MEIDPYILFFLLVVVFAGGMAFGSEVRRGFTPPRDPPLSIDRIIKPLTEGKVRKGGRNPPPKDFIRPPPPKLFILHRTVRQK